MKTLQINAVYGIGSTGTITKDLHELALERGHESYVAYSTTNIPESEIQNGYKIGKVVGKKIHALLYRVGGKQAYFSKLSTRKLIAYIVKIKPDVVNLHNLHSNYLHLNKLLSYLAKEKIKTVITLHDCWFYTGGCCHYTEVGCYKWQKECGNCPKRTTDLCAYITENSDKVLADRKKYFGAIENLTVLGVSDWVTEEAKKSFLKHKRFATVKNGIDTEFFKETESDLRKRYCLEGKFVILGLASKFFNPTNKATFEELVKSLSDDDSFILLGCSEEQKKSLPEKVIGLNYTHDRDLLRKIYSMADVFVNCSREETLSMATVEPQSCGTPAVVYDNTGIKETVLDGKTGFIVPNGDSEAFAEAVGKIKTCGKDSFKENCRKWVIEKFDRVQNYIRVLELYEDIYKN